MSDSWRDQPRWPGSTPGGGHTPGPGPGRWRDGDGPDVPGLPGDGDWAEQVAQLMARPPSFPDGISSEARRFAQEAMDWAGRVPEQYPALRVTPRVNDATGDLSIRDLSSQRDIFFDVHSGDQRVGTIRSWQRVDGGNGQTHHSVQPDIELNASGRVFGSREEALDYLSSLAVEAASKTEMDRYLDELLWHAGNAGDEIWDHGRGTDNRRLAEMIRRLGVARGSGQKARTAAAAQRLRGYLTRLGYGESLPAEPGGAR